jgi:hypothetical protein
MGDEIGENFKVLWWNCGSYYIISNRGREKLWVGAAP